MNKKNVMILFGGQSNEHEVSVMSAKNVLENIDRSKYDVVCVGITREGEWLLFDSDYEYLVPDSWQQYVRPSSGAESEAIRSPRDFIVSFAKRMGMDSVDVIFPVMHGINAEDGTLQGMLELANIPYVGPGVLASAMGMDKEISRIMFERAGIPQCKYIALDRSESADPSAIAAIEEKVSEYIGYPCFVKPANAGSSVGISKAHDKDEFIPAVLEAAKYDSKILVEEFVNGREIECAVLGNGDAKASVLGEIIASNEFYDYNAKYIDNKSQCVVPADLTGETSDAIKDYAVKAFNVLQCKGLTRVDFFVDKDNEEIYINEVNTLPGFTSISMYPMLWDAAGIGYSELIGKLIEFGIENYKSRERKLVSD